ncbi:MAG: UDP-N-acetylglucosamine 2-epimerase [Anaerovoracaceae bacterium]
MRILSVTGNRADYDLMSYLYKRFNADISIDFGLVVTGAHLNAGYESSIEEIKKDGNTIVASIKNIPEADSLASRAIAMSNLFPGFIDAVLKFKPDILIAVGDREEVNVITLVAAYLRVPCVHFFGGDFVADGHADNLARNVASTLASFHFVSIEEHKRRLIAMGEEEKRNAVIGSVALDKFKEEPIITKKELMQKLGHPEFGNYAILIYHPPHDIEGENTEIRNVLDELCRRKINTFVSYPNTDFNYSSVRKVYDEYKDKKNIALFSNFDRNTFINLYRHADFQIGNSSAGIVESASIPLPVINVGTRQLSRKAQNNVIFIDGKEESIDSALDKVQSATFMDSIKEIKNQYGDGESSQRAFEIIKNLNYNVLLNKNYDPLTGGKK